MRSREVNFVLKDKRKAAQLIIEFEALAAKNGLVGVFELHRVFEEIVIYKVKKGTAVEKLFGVTHGDLGSHQVPKELAHLIDSVRI